jgi:serine protease
MCALRSIAAFTAVAAIAAGCGGGGHHDGQREVAGTISAAAGSAIDSDTNDPRARFQRNDRAADAQEIGNPVMLGGHLNQPGAGPSDPPAGRTTLAGDLRDWFRVSLARDQTIRLQIAENGTTNDLDLELRQQNESLVASSATESRTEEIRVETTGDYYVVVVVASGFSNYTLTIGQPPLSAGPAREPAFVPGHVLVRYRDARRSGAADGPARARGLGMRHVSGEPDGPMLFAAETLAERRKAFEALGLALTPEMRGAAGPRGERSLRADTRQIAAALRRRPEIRSADLDYVRSATAVPADEFYPYQWHYGQINLPTAWDVTAPDSGVVVAVVDTGVKQGHPDLAGQLVTGFDFISDPAVANDGDGCDDDPEDPGDDAPGGSSYHGTHVTGTVTARTSFLPSDTTGVSGVAWNARVLPLRVLGVGGGTDADIMEALRYAAGRTTACAGPGAATPARIVNMSLSGPGFSQTFQDLITDLRNNEGMIFVAAAGNHASSVPEYPAGFAGVISVSAVGPTRSLAPYSNFGSSIDVAAPGGDFRRDIDGDGFPDGVLSTFFEDGRGFGYAFYQGTSMATPHVAGVLALMLGINPALTPFDIDNAIHAHEITEDVGSSQFYGDGLIDATRAVNFAATDVGGDTVLDPVLRIDPDGLNFGLLAGELHLSATNGGNDQEPLTVTGTSFTSDDGAAWLTVTPEAVDATGLGTYRASVDRSGLADGLYTGTIVFSSDRNDIAVAVIMQVGSAINAQADAGHHYIVIVNPDTLKTVETLEADAANGDYAFDFTRVDPGDYLLVAGTDSDGDGFICDEGEACGAFPTTETVERITVDADRNDIHFITGFAVDVGAAVSGAAAEPRRGYSREVGAAPGDRP